MTFPTSAFEEATEYERYILDSLATALPEPSGGHVLDLRTGKLRQDAHVMLKTVEVKAYVGGKPAPVDLTPLVFGAAWKVIDVVIDLQLLRYEGKSLNNISKKVKVAKTGNGVRLEPPFPEDIWRRLLGTYANTYDLRHSLTHRGVISHKNGSLEATPEPGQTTTTIMTRDELLYFFRAVQAMHTGLITQTLSWRDADNLRFILNQLQAHHRLGPVSGREIKGHVVIQVQGEEGSDGRVTFDLARVVSETTIRHPQAGRDLEIHLADGRVISGRFEDWPDGQDFVNPDKPPAGFVVE